MKITIDIENKTIYIDGNYTFLELEKLMNESLKDFQEYKMEYVALPYVPIIQPYIPYVPPIYPMQPYYWTCGGTFSNNNLSSSSFTNTNKP